MMKAAIILCLCTFLLVNADPPGDGGHGGDHEDGHHGGPPPQSIEALNRAKRQSPIPGLGAMLSFMGFPDPSILMPQIQQFMSQYPEVMAKVTEFVSQLKPAKRRRRQLTKWDFQSPLFEAAY